MRATSLSACCISSIDSARSFLASFVKPQFSSRAVVEPVLVDGRQLVLQRLVQDLDDFLLTLHDLGSVSVGRNVAVARCLTSELTTACDGVI